MNITPLVEMTARQRAEEALKRLGEAVAVSSLKSLMDLRKAPRKYMREYMRKYRAEKRRLTGRDR